MRLLCLAMVLSLIGGIALAQPITYPKDGKLIIPITITPTAAPKPLSRYYLTPQYLDMQPGNSVPTFMKAFAEQRNFFSKEPSDQREKWNQMPLADLPLAEIKASGCVGGLAYRKNFHDPNEGVGRPLSDVDEGARLLTSDWQMWFNIRRDGIGTLLPEVQQMRELATVLKVRMRYEVKAGDFEKAAYSAATFYGLANSFEQHPTLIGMLVGIAIDGIGLGVVEEMIQQPGCPNLYWSLTERPAEGFSPRKAAQGERVIIHAHFKPLTGDEPLTEEELQKMTAVIDPIAKLARGEEGEDKRPVPSVRFAELAKDEKKLAEFRKELTTAGRKPEAVAKFPPLQVVLAHNLLRYQILLDEMSAVFQLPHTEAMKLGTAVEAKLKADADAVLAKELLPSVSKVRSALTRQQQRVAYLRVIEAIRLHAHENGGKLPEKLADIQLPLPLDPATGKAFEYSVKGDVATLSPGNADPLTRVYEIRLRK
ncbi:MAG: hypothetical protein MUF18_11795 [Fimbriiglobus sp.]|nr:hypothetical protein [Fimbriiglobus sp.]